MAQGSRPSRQQDKTTATTAHNAYLLNRFKNPDKPEFGSWTKMSTLLLKRQMCGNHGNRVRASVSADACTHMYPHVRNTDRTKMKTWTSPPPTSACRQVLSLRQRSFSGAFPGGCSRSNARTPRTIILDKNVNQVTVIWQIHVPLLTLSSKGIDGSASSLKLHLSKIPPSLGPADVGHMHTLKGLGGGRTRQQRTPWPPGNTLLRHQPASCISGDAKMLRACSVQTKGPFCKFILRFSFLPVSCRRLLSRT